MRGAPPRSVLVTGAAGFLGAWSAAALVERGVRVTAFDLREDRRRLRALVGPDRAEPVSWVTGDIGDGWAVLDAAERAEADAVLHLAALTIPGCRADPLRGAHVDVIGHINVLEAARRLGLRSVVYASSAAALPRAPLRAPANLYGVYKRACEDIAKVYWQDHGLASVGLRPYVVYGLGRDEGETAAVTQAIRAAALGEAYAMPFAGSSSLQYAGDIAEVMVRCLIAEPQAPLIGDITTDMVSMDDVIAAIRRHIPGAQITPSDIVRPAPDVPLDDRPLRDLIGEWPRTSLDEGVHLTIEAYRRLADAR